MKLQSSQSDPSSASASVLSSQQSRLWILDQLESTWAAHVSHVCLRLQGNLDRSSLERSFAAVIARYPILSSRFTLGDHHEPKYLSDVPGVGVLSSEDLSASPGQNRFDVARKRAAEETQKSFVLETGPLFRARLFRLAPNDHLLLFVAHQIVCDRYAIEKLAIEVSDYYAAGGRNDLDSERPQYDDYIAWQREYLDSNRSARDLAFWQERLQHVTAGLELPTDNPRPPVQTFRGKKQSLPITGDLLQQLTAASSHYAQPVFVKLLTAFICWLHRCTSAEEIVIGSVLSGRNAPGADCIIGPLSNPVVLRVDCSGDPTFETMLHRVSVAWAEAEEHHDLPFGVILEKLQVPRDMSRSPLFQVRFSHQSQLEPFTAAGLDFEPIRIDDQSEPLDFSVTVSESSSQIELDFSYSTDLFEDSTIQRHLSHFHTLLSGAVNDGGLKLSKLPVLTPEQYRQIVVEWNSTQTDYPTDIPLHKLIEEQVERTPDAPALVCDSRKLTYRELNQRANQLAHYLRKRGVGPDVFVGVCMERSVEMVLALLGTMKAGGAYVPLDPEYPADRLQSMIEDAKPPVILTQERLRGNVPQNSTPVLCLDRDWDSVAHESVANPAAAVGGKNLAYAIYTSGSTGKPKGVPNTHQGIVNRLLWMQDTYQLNASDRVLQKTPYSFDVSVWEFFWPLLSGACLVMAKPGGHKDPYYLIDTICKHRITTLHFVPSMLSIFLESDGVERCQSVRRVFASGEALPFDLQQRFFECLKAELHNLYGPTEAAVDVTFWACRPNSKQTVVPIGRPVANTQIYILDSQLSPVPIGVAGELHIGGRQLARGYLNRPELTAQKFIPDPFSTSPDARLYKTGDLARFMPDGNVEYLGRIDNQVKLRGFRIELGEIESALGEFPGVRQAVVVVREDAPGDKRLVAYIALSAGDLDHEAVRAHLRTKLPDFMIPSTFVVVSAFPMTTSGKVDRKALPAPHQHAKTRSAGIAPRSETQQLVVSLFQEILRVDSVGINDDFFDLGGHSLLAARLVSEIYHRRGKRIPLSLLFRGSTPEYLARVIDQGVELAPESTATLIQDGDSGLPFFAVVPPGENAVGYIKLARLLGQEQEFYNLQGPGPLLVGRPYTWDEMDNLATQYVEAMRKVQPEGPYVFGGMCDGAHLAIRMAKKLDDAGAKVGMLAILDTWVLENSQRRWAWTIDYYGKRLKEILQLPVKEQVLQILRPAARLVRRLLRLPQPPRPWMQAYWPGKDHVPPTFSGRVTLFKRPKQPYFYKPDPQMGWGARARGGVDIEVLPIHHAEMLHEPSVQILAERLRSRLAKLAEKSSPVSENIHVPSEDSYLKVQSKEA